MTVPPWSTSSPTLRLAPVAGPSGASPAVPHVPSARTSESAPAPEAPATAAAPSPAPSAAPTDARAAGTRRPLTLARLGEIARSPGTALAVMVLGLALLFVWPVVGLPFVALVVLPTVVYHLRAEQRVRMRRQRR